MTKLQYLIKTSYYIRPEFNSDTYQENITKIVTGIIAEYIENLRNNEIPKESIILNLKEIIYGDLTFAFTERSEKEKENLVNAYLYIIAQASDIILYTISSRVINPQIALNQINNYISYTQFWETQNWQEFKDRIENIIVIHRRKIIGIAYRIIHLIVTFRIESTQYFKIVRQIIDLYGFIDINEFSDNWYEDLIEPSSFHVIRFDDSYFTTIFLYVIYLLESTEVVDRYFEKILQASKNDNKSSICRALLNKLDDISSDEIKVLSSRSYEEINDKRESLIKYIKDKVESFEEVEREKVFTMEISETKFEEYKEDLKKNIYYSDLELKCLEPINIQIASYFTYVPRLAMVEQNGTIFVGGYRNEELIGYVMYNEIKGFVDEPIKILALNDIDAEFTKLLLPREYYMDIVQEFGYFNFPESNDSFFNEVKIGNRNYYYHWITNTDSIYAISTKTEGLLIDYKKVDVSIVDTIKNKKNEAILRIKIDIPYIIPDSFKLKKYSIQRIKKDV